MQPLLSPADLKLMLRSPGFPRTYRNSPPVTHPALTPPLTVQRHEGAGLRLPSPQAPHLFSGSEACLPRAAVVQATNTGSGPGAAGQLPHQPVQEGVSLWGLWPRQLSRRDQMGEGRSSAQPSCGCKKGHCARGQGGSLSCPNAPPRPHGSSGVRGWGQQGREGLWPGDRGSPPSPAGPGARRKLLLPTGPVSPS